MWVLTVILSILNLCAAALESNIIVTKDAEIEDWPFIAFIVYFAKYGDILPACGGSLLSSQTILTAAHCLDDITEKKENLNKFEGVYVLLGHADIYNSTETRTVIDYLTHSSYDMRNTAYDIGIILLDSSVTFSKTIKKTVLRTTPLENAENQVLYVAGWGGSSGAGHISPHLKYLAYKILSKNICQKILEGINLESGTICARPLNSSFVFSGDSGGPLITKDGYQVGVVSYKLEEKSEGVTIFTHIPDYVDWIKSTQDKLLHKYRCG